MNNIKYFIVFIFTLLISSCSVSKKSLNTELVQSKEKNKVLNIEKQKMINKIRDLKLALENSKNKNEPVIVIAPSIDIPKKENKGISQLLDFEKVISNDASLSAKFSSFKDIKPYLYHFSRKKVEQMEDLSPS